MLLADLVQTSDRVAAASARLDKIASLRDCLKRLVSDEVATAVAFLSGETLQGRLGIGPATIAKTRDIDAAPTPSLTLADVNVSLAKIAGLAGAGASADRQRLLGDLISRATAPEQKFLARLLFGELRQGALEGVMVEAIAQAANLPAPAVRRAWMLAGKLYPVARAALEAGEAGLQRFSMQLFQPVLPMLAQPAKDVADALAQLGIAALEWKLDGARVQVHKSEDQVRVYSRGLNDVTPAVPEIVDAARTLRVRDAILDGEAIALRSDLRPQPFQVTMRRFGRRFDVHAMRRELPLHVLLFDVLRIDGQDVIDRSSRERFELLAHAVPGELLIPRLITSDPSAAQAFLDEALARGHEGIMAKALDAPYQAGSRGSSWLKIKQAHTLDLVILAAEWGSGRRSGRLSNLHLGARDPDHDSYVMLGKTFKGLTDQMLEWQTGRLLELEARRDNYTVYVRPELVVEIAVNEIQLSHQYPAGLALRFARVKGYRPDKRPEDADTIDTVRELFLGHGGRVRG